MGSFISLVANAVAVRFTLNFLVAPKPRSKARQDCSYDTAQQGFGVAVPHSRHVTILVEAVQRFAMTPKRAFTFGVRLQKAYAENRTLRKSAIKRISPRWLFIKDCAESVAVMAEPPAVLFCK
jgi:hypothetical protein